MLVSPDEVRNEDTSGILPFQEYLLELDEKLNKREDNTIDCNEITDFSIRSCKQRYLMKERLAVLLNSPWHQVHGEARLLDPRGEILTEILAIPMKRDEKDYLFALKESFYNVHEDHIKRILLLFSSNIPCTVPEYMCSNLIGRFVAKEQKIVIVAYDKIFYSTDEKSALNNMRDNGVYVVTRKTMRHEVNKEIKKWTCTSKKDIHRFFDDTFGGDAMKERRNSYKFIEKNDEWHQESPYRRRKVRRAKQKKNKQCHLESCWKEEYVQNMLTELKI